MSAIPCFKRARALRMIAIALACTLATNGWSQVLTVDRDLTLDPQATYAAIVITKSDITIEGRGAVLRGPGGARPADYQGTAILADGVSGVTLRNLRVRGWERGLHVAHGRNWVIEDCDFSDNFHDPDFGWGENGRRGGILLEHVTHSTVRRCRANRVWDGCVLVDSDHNTLEHNDFSHASNTCLKFWHASHNRVHDNLLSHGIRKQPEEVHARDSTCVLIESGSNSNRLERNDCRYGGDGIFIRVLNGWVSTDNYFAENDCSHANNNCIEAWSPRNTWVRNRANHGSYGFWLGASDKNTLIDNEASFNGLTEGPHNSPHLPDNGHAGIVFMFGPSSHTVLRGNRCQGNHGAGIAGIGDLESRGTRWNAFHWIVERNVLSENRWGIYLQHAEMLTLAGNRFQDNKIADVWCVENVTALEQRPSTDEPAVLPAVELVGPDVVTVGKAHLWDASASRDALGSELAFQWRLQPSAESHTESQWPLTFSEPGFYRLALTVNNRLGSNLAYRDLYVVRDDAQIEPAGDPATWSSMDAASQVRFERDTDNRLIGKDSLRATISPYSGGRVWLRHTFPRAADFASFGWLEFWLKYRNENVPAWQDQNPIVVIHGGGSEAWQLTPDRDLLSQPPYLEAREGWTLFRVPLQGNTTWIPTGDKPQSVEAVSLGFDSWGAPPLIFWVDGLMMLAPAPISSEDGGN